MSKHDKRIKGCPNEVCQMHTEKVKQKPDMYYCPKCGTPLIFVCDKCFCEIEDIGPDHNICAGCSAIQAQNKRNQIEAIKNVGKTLGAGAAALGVAVFSKALPVLKKGVVDKGAKIVVEIGKTVLKLK